MCGIAGVLNSSSTRSSLERDALAMADSLTHRGPDARGVWYDLDAGLALTHRRLSILDLSAAGHQPMVSANGRFVISYNGEIYNFQELRTELKTRGVSFRGHSDTEVILEAFVTYGIAATIKRLIGMFAIAVWDRHERALTLIRDRIGKKPLYWARFGRLFLFGSELKALRVYPGWTPRIDRRAVASYMRHNYIPAPYSIYEGVHKLEPGCILTLRWQSEPRIEHYWSAREVALTGLANPLDISNAELTDHLEEILRDAVKRRMVADVPVGAFLSGGIDSSTVVALMKAVNSGPVRTYSIGFDVPAYDEARHASAVARYLNTDHTEFIVTPRDAIEVIPRLPEIYDEPFADSSQIPTYLVSAMTRQHVSVSLSGDGGDELFAGYDRYRLTQQIWRCLCLLPPSLSHAFARALRAVPADRWSQLLNFLPTNYRPAQFGDKLHKLASVLTTNTASGIYRKLVTHWEPDTVMPGIDELKGPLWDATVVKDFPGLLERMQFLDLATYLPDDILTKVDRASMAIGLEARTPLLDHRVVEFAWRIPRRSLIRNGLSKWPLRQILYRHIPRKLVERPKMGFGVPLDEWLRGPLRDWAETLMSEQRLRDVGLLDISLVRRKWSEHLSGQRNWQYPLWDVLMLQAWHERWRVGA